MNTMLSSYDPGTNSGVMSHVGRMLAKAVDTPLIGIGLHATCFTSLLD